MCSRLAARHASKGSCPINRHTCIREGGRRLTWLLNRSTCAVQQAQAVVNMPIWWLRAMQSAATCVM